MEILIVTGLSGAGKSQAVHTLEDIGFFCIDNIPASHAGRIVELCEQANHHGRYALVMDIRSRVNFKDFDNTKEAFLRFGHTVKVLYLEAADEVLMRRYKETRRKHPLMVEGASLLQEAIVAERRIIEPARANADYVIDTSMLSSAQLRERVLSLFAQENEGALSVTAMSFGFKYGIPADADLVFDVRCLPNPYYIAELRPLTGCDQRVRDYVFGFSEANELLKHINSLLDYSLPLYMREGKSSLVIAFGCTGGQHRSVSFAEVVGKKLLQQYPQTAILHRDYKR